MNKPPKKKNINRANNKKVDRNRKLNVVYFIDSAKTRSFTIRMSMLNLLFAGIGLAMAWTALTTGSLYYMMAQNTAHEKKYQEALSTIFDYQTRHDRVYERAYPSAETESVAGSQWKPSASALASNSVAPVSLHARNDGSAGDTVASGRKKSKSAKKTERLGRRKKSLTKTKSTSTSKAKLAKQPSSEPSKTKEKAAAPSWKLEVLKPKATLAGKGFEINFAIRNHVRKKKANGNVWAVATLVRKNGEIIFIPAPSHLKISKNGTALNPKKAHRFSIRNFKEKKFAFLMPSGFQGKLTSVEIGLMSPSGETQIKKIRPNLNYAPPPSQGTTTSQGAPGRSSTNPDKVGKDSAGGKKESSASQTQGIEASEKRRVDGVRAGVVMFSKKDENGSTNGVISNKSIRRRSGEPKNNSLDGAVATVSTGSDEAHSKKNRN